MRNVRIRKTKPKSFNGFYHVVSLVSNYGQSNFIASIYFIVNLIIHHKKEIPNFNFQRDISNGFLLDLSLLRSPSLIVNQRAQSLGEYFFLTCQFYPRALGAIRRHKLSLFYFQTGICRFSTGMLQTSSFFWKCGDD